MMYEYEVCQECGAKPVVTEQNGELLCERCAYE